MAEKNLKLINEIKKELQKGLVGQDDLVESLLVGILANGHILLEGVPGLAKTRAVSLLAKACSASFKRLQFTPDLLPADIVGTRIFDQKSASFETRIGPIFANFILADEINRAPAKVQSALLETMQERQVTIGDETIALPLPFFVFATQNPVEQEGTYPLPEAQLDRFLLKVVVGYPQKDEEAEIVRMVINETQSPAIDKVMNAEDIIELQKATRDVHLEDKLLHYITTLVFATREPSNHGLSHLQEVIELGASPRASIALAQCSKALALLDGRSSVYPDDIKKVAYPVLRHRILLTFHGEAEGFTTARVISEILGKVKVP